MREGCPLPSIPGLLLKRFGVPAAIVGLLLLFLGQVFDINLCRVAGWVTLVLAPVPVILLGMLHLMAFLVSSGMRALERYQLGRASAWLDDLEQRGGNDEEFAKACASVNARFGSHVLNERISDRRRNMRERYLRHANSNVIEQIACSNDDPIAIRAWAEILRRRYGIQVAGDGEESRRHWQRALSSPDPFARPEEGSLSGGSNPATDSMTCAACGQRLKLAEKYTGGGRDIRTYECTACGKMVDVDMGIATWKALSDAREPESRPPEPTA